MDPESTKQGSAKALEEAAKYICTLKCGSCPMAVEKIPCPQQCTLEVRPWECWIAYFQKDRHPLAEHK